MRRLTTDTLCAGTNARLGSESLACAAPVELTVLDHRLDCTSGRPLAVAFSGGGDSLAVLLLCLDWARAAGRKVVALTVDHGLCAESAAWTHEAGEVTRKLGADWRSLSWTGDKPGTGLQAAARQARHRLLAEAAREIGACVILVGHTADDVRESEVIRHATPSLGRMRAWSPSPAWPQGRGVFLLRPLLATRRDDLRTRLRALGLSWRDDPANADLRFARTRARVGLASREGTAASPGDDPSEGDLHMPLAGAFSATADGRLVATRRDLSYASPEVARRVLGSALLCASGGTRPPRSSALERLRTQLGGVAPFTTILAGARVVADAEVVTFVREAGEQVRAGLSPTALLIDQPAVFDGRFEVQPTASGFTVAALAGHAARLDRVDAERLRACPAVARPSLPVLIDPLARPSRPAPFGRGLGHARALAGDRFAAACGLVSCEAELHAASAVWRPAGGHPIFNSRV